MIPPGFIQELLSRTDIVELVGRHVELKKAGIHQKGLCPFHSEKSPSFTVSPTRQTYHCFGCGAHGDALRFMTEYLGVSFMEAVHELAQATGLQVPEDKASPAERAQAARQREHQATLTEVLTRASDHYRTQLKHSPRAIDYLKRRGLTGEIAQRFALGYAPEGWRSLAGVFPRYDDPLLAESGMVIVQGEDSSEQKRYDRFRDRIMFPIRDVKGEIIAFGGRVIDSGEPKYLNSPETPLFVKGRELYGLHEARTALRERGYALVCEGYMDVVALAQLGFPNAVATLGTACTADHVRKLLRFTDAVVFSFDGDAAGRRAAGRALEAALPHASDTRSFRFLFLPVEHDPDSYVRELGAEAFEARVREAVPLSRQLVAQAAQDCDLDLPEGRSRMLAQAKPLWQLLPEGGLRLQMLAELARLGGLGSEELLALWGSSSTGRSRPLPKEVDDDDVFITPWDGTPPPEEETPPPDEPPPRFQRPPGRETATPWRSRRHTRHADAALPMPVGRRPPPKRPEDRVVQMLLGQPAWWEQLPHTEQELLHHLPDAHGLVMAWLERNLAEQGPRPWDELAAALQADELLDDSTRQLAASLAPDPEATWTDLRRVVDILLERDLAQRMKTLLSQAEVDPQALVAYRELDSLWREVRQRQGALGPSPG